MVRRSVCWGHGTRVMRFQRRQIASGRRSAGDQSWRRPRSGSQGADLARAAAAGKLRLMALTVTCLGESLTPGPALMQAPHDGSTSLRPPSSKTRGSALLFGVAANVLRAELDVEVTPSATRLPCSTAAEDPAYMSMSAFLPPVHEPPYAMSILTVARRLAFQRDRRCADRRRRDHRLEDARSIRRTSRVGRARPPFTMRADVVGASRAASRGSRRRPRPPR